MNSAFSNGDHEEDDLDQWSNAIGDDDALDQLWEALIAATAEAGPKEMESVLGRYLSGLGARSRRTTEGLILAVMAATAGDDANWEDWRVILHRHFALDERMEVSVAAAILLEWRKTEIAPDWHSQPEQVMERVLASYVRDMHSSLSLLDKPEEASAAASDLAMLASQLFDFAIALEGGRQEELQNSAESARLLSDLERTLGERAEDQPKAVAADLGKARALLEVTMRQLEIDGGVVH
ncbi:hypothetical protein [Acidisoma sp. 7E03]